jgi:hypothetical protein
MFDAITLSTGDIDFLKLRTVGDSGVFRPGEFQAENESELKLKLLLVLRHCLPTTEKDSWGVEYSSGFQIFRGYYYDNSRKDPFNIQINSKKTSHCSCIISVVYLCRC